MFTITNPRIVTLIAVVCAVAVAPQALGASSIHSRIAPPGDEPSGFELGELKNGRAVFTVATPDAVQGYALSGFDLSALNGIPGYQQQQEYLKGLALAALAGGTTKSVKVQPESQWRSPIGQPANNTPGGFDLGDLKDRRAAFTAVTHKSITAGSTAAAIKALQRRSVDLNAAYRKLYPGAYRHGSMQTNPGWGAAATQAKTPAAEAAVKTAPAVCLGYAEYVYSGCEWWS